MTSLIAQDNIVDDRLFNPFPLDMPKTLDITILNLLIHHAITCGKTFYGLSSHNILRGIKGFKMRGGTPKFTLKEIGEVRRALLLLERNGLVYQIKHSRSRWSPTTKAVTAHGFSEGSQTSLEKWVMV